MDIKFRKLDYTKDIDDVCRWHKDHVAINFPDSKYKRNLFADSVRIESTNTLSEMIIITEGEYKIGFLWLKTMWDRFKDENYCDLHYIHLIPEYRGKGLGQKLLSHAEKWAKKHDCKEIRLGTAADNEAAVSAYTKAGYITKRVIMEKVL